MKFNKIAGIITIIVGIIFVVLPIFFINLLSTTMGLAIICFGISNMLEVKEDINNSHSIIFAVIGIMLILTGFLVMFFKISSFMNDFEFYIIGVIFIILGITEFVANINRIHDLSSIVTVIIGILSIMLALSSMINLVHIPILIGFALFFDGFALLISN